MNNALSPGLYMLFLIKYYSWHGNLENEKNQLVGSEYYMLDEKKKAGQRQWIFGK